MKQVDVYIDVTGDPTVGLFPTHWILENVSIEDEDRDIFAEALSVCFDVIGEEVMITFSDEIAKDLEEILRHNVYNF